METVKFIIKLDSHIIDTAVNSTELYKKVAEVEKILAGIRYKKEFCQFNEYDGIFMGFHFTIFD